MTLNYFFLHIGHSLLSHGIIHGSAPKEAPVACNALSAKEMFSPIYITFMHVLQRADTTSSSHVALLKYGWNLG